MTERTQIPARIWAESPGRLDGLGPPQWFGWNCSSVVISEHWHQTQSEAPTAPILLELLTKDSFGIHVRNISKSKAHIDSCRNDHILRKEAIPNRRLSRKNDIIVNPFVSARCTRNTKTPIAEVVGLLPSRGLCTGLRLDSFKGPSGVSGR